MLDRQKNIIITGIPRSGTTLLTAMIDSAPNAVGLHEPGWQAAWMHRNPGSTPEDFIKWLLGDFVLTRKRLLEGVPIPDRRAADGSRLTNYFRRGEKPQQMVKNFEIVPFVKQGLTANFTLAMKHNGLFISVLPDIIATSCFTIIAIIRSREEVLASWRRLDLPVSHGRMPAAEYYWPEMKHLVHTPMDLHTKQGKMYDLCVQRLMRHAGDIHIVRYEDFINNPHPAMRLTGVKDYVDMVDRNNGSTTPAAHAHASR